MDLALSLNLYTRTSILTSSLAAMKALVALDGWRAPGDPRALFTVRSLALATGLGQPAIRKALDALPSLRIRVDDDEFSPISSIGDGVATFADSWTAWSAQGREPMSAVEFCDLSTRAGVMLWLRAPVGASRAHRVVADEACLLVGDPGGGGPTSIDRKLIQPGAVDFNRASRSYDVTVEARVAGNRYLRWWTIRYAATESRDRDAAPELPLEVPKVPQPEPMPVRPRRLVEPLPDETLPADKQRAIVADQKTRGVYDREGMQARIASVHAYEEEDIDVPDD